MEIRELNKYGINPIEVKKYIDRVKSPNVSVAITGEFSSGKSTFVNALINKKNLLSHKNDECTPVFVELIKSYKDKFEVTYNDKSVEEIDLNEKNIELYTTYKAGYDENILGITLPIDSEYLKENVTIIDTPGTNTVIKKHEEITEYVLKSVDIVIYVLNKVVGQSDIEKINEIYKYTNNIMVVVTHMDEKVDGKWVNRESEVIERLINTVKEELLKANSDFIDIEIFPIGSLSVYEDDTYISEIRKVIDEYVDFNNEKVIKKRVESQLNIFFEETIKDIKLQVNTYEALKSKDIEDIDKKINKINLLIQRNHDKKEKQLKELDIEDKDIKKIENNITKLFEDEKNIIIKKILSDENLSELEISNIIKKSLNKISVCIRGIVENYIKSKIDNLFDESNEELKFIIKDIDISLENNIFIEKPSVDLIDDDYFNEEVYKLKMKKNNIESELLLINEDIDRLKEENDIQDNLINKCKDNLNNLRKDRAEHGNYTADYEEVIDYSGKESGAKIGRFIGEVADIALLLTTPQAGALKAADKVKDASKITKIVGESVKNVKKVSKGVKKIKKKAKDASMLDKLKYLEAGFYGEKIGERLGEFIKPTKTILIENEEEKLVHEKKSKEIQESINIEADKLYELKKEKDECLISMGEYRRKKAEAETNIKNYKIEEEVLLNKIEREKSLTKDNLIKEYYEENISEVFNEKMEESLNIGVNIILNSNEKLIEKTNSIIENKLYELKNTLNNLSKDKNKIEEEIKEDMSKLNELKNYKNWISDWID